MVVFSKMHKYIQEVPAEKIIIRIDKERLRKEREKNGLDPTIPIGIGIDRNF